MQKFYIISAHRADCSNLANRIRHQELVIGLLRADLTIKSTTGMFCGTKEMAVIVDAADMNSLQYKVLRKFLKEYQQECFIFVNCSNQLAYFHYEDGLNGVGIPFVIKDTIHTSEGAAHDYTRLGYGEYLHIESQVN